MIWIWLVLLAFVYVVVAIVVGKMCAINSRWEKSVDEMESGPTVSRPVPGRPGEMDLLAAEGGDGVNRKKA